MKKLLTFLLPALMLFAAGCKDKNEPSSKTLSVNPEFITCPNAGGDYTVTVTSLEGAWSATTNESWIKVTPTSGEQGTTEVRIKISPNKESAETKGIITFTSGEETVSCPVTRAAKAAPYLYIVSDQALNTPKEGGSYTIQVESNIKWSASSNAGWAKVSKGVSVNNDHFTVTVSPATTPEETTARIIVSPYGEGYDAGSDTVIITRGSTEATSLSVDPTEINAPETGGTFTVNVSSNAKWRVYKTWDMDWLTFSGSQDGDGNGSFSFSIEEATSMDDVSGILTIEEDRSDNYKPVVTQVAVSRAGKTVTFLSVNPTNINVPYRNMSTPYDIIIKSKYPWKATLEGTEIFSANPTECIFEGEGITITRMEVVVRPATLFNPSEGKGKIIIRTTKGNEEATIYIHRDGYPYPPHDKFSFTVSSDGKQVYFSKGNLQYNPLNTHNNAPNQWRFAEHQYDVIGAEYLKSRYFELSEYVHDSLKNVITMWKYNDWVDLFCYATSGYSHYPYDPIVFWSTYDDVYNLGDIAGTYDDWGVWLSYKNLLPSNATSCGRTGTGQWRTLTHNEWHYMIYRDSCLLFATVNNKPGIILLPDLFEEPGNLSVSLKYCIGKELADGYGIVLIGNYLENVIGLADWNKMEAAGAVFLPNAGTGSLYPRLSGGYSFTTRQEFTYWASTLLNSKFTLLLIDESELYIGKRAPYIPCAVRLVQDVE